MMFWVLAVEGVENLKLIDPDICQLLEALQ